MLVYLSLARSIKRLHMPSLETTRAILTISDLVSVSQGLYRIFDY